MIRAVAPDGGLLDDDTVRETLHRALEGRYAGQRVLVLIPDHTRSIPLPLLWRLLVEILHDAARLDFVVALGTHPPLTEERLQRLVGIDAHERSTTYRHVGLGNHAWERPDTFVSVGTLPQERVRQLAGDRWHPTLGGDVDIRINRAILDADAILILGPTFPHEVVGFSGGAKYLFPGISGADMIDVTHWLGALSGVRGTIGVRDTPVRAMIHEAAEHVPTPIELIALTVVDGGLAGVFVGDHVEAWEEAVALSQRRHIVWVDRPFRRVLSWAPPMYDELWTAGKAMYKLEPALAEGGELVIYAPHLERISRVHGRHIREIGYHVLPYFLAQWERFAHLPLGVLAHSTHVRGDGEYRGGVELPRAQVTLSTKLTPEVCAELALGYLDPAEVDPDAWRGREEEGVLLVPKAGEVLYKLRE